MYFFHMYRNWQIVRVLPKYKGGKSASHIRFRCLCKWMRSFATLCMLRHILKEVHTPVLWGEYSRRSACERWSDDVTDIAIFDGARTRSGYQWRSSQMSENGPVLFEHTVTQSEKWLHDVYLQASPLPWARPCPPQKGAASDASHYILAFTLDFVCLILIFMSGVHLACWVKGLVLEVWFSMDGLKWKHILLAVM